MFGVAGEELFQKFGVELNHRAQMYRIAPPREQQARADEAQWEAGLGDSGRRGSGPAARFPFERGSGWRLCVVLSLHATAVDGSE